MLSTIVSRVEKGLLGASFCSILLNKHVLRMTLELPVIFLTPVQGAAATMTEAGLLPSLSFFFFMNINTPC